MVLTLFEATLYKNKSKVEPWTSQEVEIFEMIQKSRDYIRGRAPSVKMILMEWGGYFQLLCLF